MEILSQHMVTDLPDSVGQSFLGLCGYSMSQQAARQCLQESRMNIRDIDVVEVHDCFAPNEVWCVCGTSLCEPCDHQAHSL